MTQYFNVLPSGDVENDGWTLVAASATTVWEILSAPEEDDCYVSCPQHRGGLEVSFPTDVSDLPNGAIIDSVTVFIRMKTSSGSGARGVTVNVLSSENRSRYTTRNLWANSTITTYEVGTYTKDPLGRAWDIHRINKLRLRLFSQNNFSEAIRVYSLYVRVNFHTKPTVSVIAPSGTVGTPSPEITWSYNQIEGEPQKLAEYRIFTIQQTALPTFNPTMTPPVYFGRAHGIGTSRTLPTSLNNNTYKVYVRALSVNGAVSDMAFKQFTVSAPSPGVPGDNNAGIAGLPGVGIPTVTPDNYTSSTAIRMQDSSNLLSVQQADFEIPSDALGWVSAANSTVARSTAAAFSDGIASLGVTAVSAGTSGANTDMVEVDPDKPVTIRAQLLAATSARTATLTAVFYDDNFDQIAGADITASVTDSTSTWKEAVGNGTTPEDAAYCALQVRFSGASGSETHYVDHVGLMYGTDTAWSDGGHCSRNLLTAFLATGDDPASVTDSWVQANAASTTTRVNSTGTGANGAKCNQMSYIGVSPSISYRATGTTFNSTTSGTNYTLNKPSGLQDNDLMIAFVTSTEHGTINPPSGWTAVNSVSIDDGTTDIALFVLKRTGLASDPASWSTGTLSTASSRRTAVVVSYAGAAHADDQFIAEGARTDSTGAVQHRTAQVMNNDPNAWRVSAFAASDNVTGGAFTANATPGVIPPIAYVGKSVEWGTFANTSTYVITKPSGVVSGDLMLASVVFPGIIATVNTPPGWTLVQKMTTAASGDVQSGQMTACIFKRTAGSSEPNTWKATHTFGSKPKLTQVVAYRNCEVAASQFIATNHTTKVNGSSIGTGTVTNTDSKAWRVCMFAGLSVQGGGWDGGDVAERADATTTLLGYPDPVIQFSDSNGMISTGDHSRTASFTSGSFYSAVGWTAILKPLSVPPAVGTAETERVDFRAGSANPWETTAVYDSGANIQAGIQSVYGSFTSSDGAADSMASWIAIIRPAASVLSGEVAAYPNTMIDISDVSDEVLELANNKLTVMSNFLGSVEGTPTLTAEFYRANQLLGTQSAPGRTFDTTVWTKSWAVFDIPEGATRIRPILSAIDVAVGDGVQFTRTAVMLGGLGDSTQEPKWRNGTARREHPVWSKPILQYREDDGNGYGDWKNLAGQKILRPSYDLATGQMLYVDHTIVPRYSRQYRVSTYSYGLAGDFFSSGYGPASNEAIFESRAWWLKDVRDLAKNMQIQVRWTDQQVDTTNLATQFQPIGAKYPVVVTEGFKGDTFALEIHCEQTEFNPLMNLLNSGRTLILQSDIDRMWWVRPVGNIQTNILATGSRQERPRRYVTVSFVEVAPEE